MTRDLFTRLAICLPRLGESAGCGDGQSRTAAATGGGARAAIWPRLLSPSKRDFYPTWPIRQVVGSRCGADHKALFLVTTLHMYSRYRVFCTGFQIFSMSSKWVALSGCPRETDAEDYQIKLARLQQPLLCRVGCDFPCISTRVMFRDP